MTMTVILEENNKQTKLNTKLTKLNSVCKNAENKTLHYIPESFFHLLLIKQ